MENRFRFYEVVTIALEPGPELEEIAGREGTVLGMSQDEKGAKWTYAVAVTSNGEVWHIEEQHLESTGQIRERSEVYSGESIRVKVNRETGEGSLE